MEVEKKYLVNKIPFDLTGLKKTRIVQTYLLVEPEVRIRKSDDEYTLTVKGEGDLARKENEIEICKESFNRLLLYAVTNQIIKTRYYIPLDNGLSAEFDIYEGELQGLMTVEVEFKSGILDEAIKQAELFQKPDWFGIDITKDKRFKNKYLATYSKNDEKYKTMCKEYNIS